MCGGAAVSPVSRTFKSIPLSTLETENRVRCFGGYVVSETFFMEHALYGASFS